MPATVTIRSDYSAFELRRLDAGSKDANQSRRLLSLAAVLYGMGRADAARIGGMHRQTPRDWVRPFSVAAIRQIGRQKERPPRGGLSMSNKARSSGGDGSQLVAAIA
jgi:hypothetical protein